MTEHSSKRPRVISFGRTSRLSRSALQAVLQQVLEEGLPDNFSRSTQERQVRRIATQQTSFGPLMQKTKVVLENGKMHDLWYIHPLGFIEVATRDLGMFNTFMRQTLDLHNNHVSLIVYNDEVDPGRELATRHARKIEAVYWSFVEYGLPALNHEHFYFTFTVLRSDIRMQVAGGMSQVVKQLLRVIFNTGGVDMRVGVVCRFRGDNAARLIIGNVKVMLQDERAHKCITLSKGATGVMPCALCMNVHNHRFKRPSPTDLPLTHLKVTDFVLHSNDSIRAIFSRLQERANA